MKILLLIISLIFLSGCENGYWDKDYKLPPGIRYQRVTNGELGTSKDFALWITLEELPYEQFKIRLSECNNGNIYISVNELKKILFLRQYNPDKWEEIWEKIIKEVK